MRSRGSVYVYYSEGVFRLLIIYRLKSTRKLPCCSTHIGPLGGVRGILLLDCPYFNSSLSLSVLSVLLPTFGMWLVAASIPLFPTIIVAWIRYSGHVTALCRQALAWTLRVLLRRKVCVRSTHAYVFSNCTHGKADSVLEAFDLYTNTYPSLCISAQMCEYASDLSHRCERERPAAHQYLFFSGASAAVLDQAVARVRPSLVLELGMHCGYSSVRLLRLLPPAGRLITVEVDLVAAELGEEILLVAGFKHSQVQPGSIKFQ